MRASRLKATAFYEFFNANPKGRLGADCVIRAAALMVGASWEQAVREMTELGIKRGYVLNDTSLFPAYLKEKGFTQMPEPRDAMNKKMSVKEFLEKHPEERCFVASVGTHHVTAVKDGKVRDIWDCSGETMHRWWKKP